MLKKYVKMNTVKLILFAIPMKNIKISFCYHINDFLYTGQEKLSYEIGLISEWSLIRKGLNLKIRVTIRVKI